jgi:hypothetical protein
MFQQTEATDLNWRIGFRSQAVAKIATFKTRSAAYFMYVSTGSAEGRYLQPGMTRKPSRQPLRRRDGIRVTGPLMTLAP